MEAGTLHDGVPEAVYHADANSLSASGAKLLLPPSTPANFRWRMDHPEPPRADFDLGTAIHTGVLGVGAGVVTVDSDKWLSAAVKAQVAEIRRLGGVPLKPRDAAIVFDAVDAVRNHPIAGALFAEGVAEQSAWWPTPVHVPGLAEPVETWRRARFDWLTVDGDGQLTAVDLKTTAKSAAPQSFARTVADFRYHLQAAHYLQAARSVGLGDIAWLWCTVEKDPPHLVTVTRPDDEMLSRGWELADLALSVFAECQASGQWPGHQIEISTLTLPRWT